jgi:ADP-ribose pyrophosphatase YjhB (NUDIX family)|tara:strand:+ start:526 stop:1284 length:759 start_codon:yes stop_codon:yes gene_type:complete
MSDYIHLEHDGKLLLVNNDGEGPAIPQLGRTNWKGDDFLIRLPTPDEATKMGIKWEVKRKNNVVLGETEKKIIIAIPKIKWPENWAWKDSVISDSAVDPVARESVYRTIHRVVSKVIIQNKKKMILMAKVNRGFFTGCWTLPGGFVDYGEHPRTGAVREALEELGINILIPDKFGESGEVIEGNDGLIIQENIFTSEGINWLSFTYRCELDIPIQEIIPKDDEIEEAKWFTIDDALRNAVSIFDRDAILRIE